MQQPDAVGDAEQPPPLDLPGLLSARGPAEEPMAEPIAPDADAKLRVLPPQSPDYLSSTILFDDNVGDEEDQAIDFYNDGSMISPDEDSLSDSMVDTSAALVHSPLSRRRGVSPQRSRASHRAKVYPKDQPKAWVPSCPKPPLVSASALGGRVSSPSHSSRARPVEKEVAGMSRSLRPIVSELVEGIYERPLTISILVPNYDRSPSPESRARRQKREEGTLSKKKPGPRLAKQHRIRYFRLTAHDLAMDRSAAQTVLVKDLLHFQRALLKELRNERALREFFRPEDMEWWKRHLRYVSGYDRPTGQFVVMVNHALLREDARKFVQQYEWMSASLTNLPPASERRGGDDDAPLTPQPFVDFSPAIEAIDLELAQRGAHKDPSVFELLEKEAADAGVGTQGGSLTIEIGSPSGDASNSFGLALPSVHSKSSPVPAASIFNKSLLEAGDSGASPPKSAGAGRRVDRDALLRKVKPSRPASSPAQGLPQLSSPKMVAPRSPSSPMSPPKSPLQPAPSTPLKLSERTAALLHNIYMDEQDLSRLQGLIIQESAVKELNYKIYMDYKKEGNKFNRKRHTYDSITSDYEEIMRPTSSPYPPRSPSPPRSASGSPTKSPPSPAALRTRSVDGPISPVVVTRGRGLRASTGTMKAEFTIIPPVAEDKYVVELPPLRSSMGDISISSLPTADEPKGDHSPGSAFLATKSRDSVGTQASAKGSRTRQSVGGASRSTSYNEAVEGLTGSAKRAADIIRRAREHITNDEEFLTRKPSNMEVQLFFSPLAKRLIPAAEQKVQQIVEKIVVRS